MIKKIREFFWPILEKSDVRDLQKTILTADIETLRETSWESDLELALQEARRLSTEEDERRKTAESKASNLLLLAGALVPLVTYLETTLWGSQNNPMPAWVNLTLSALAISYLVRAALWAFRTIDVGNYHRVYPNDLVKIWAAAGKSVKLGLIIEMFVAIRRDQESVNEKVSFSKMTHAFLLRAIIVFSLLLLFRIAAGFGVFDIETYKGFGSIWSAEE